MQKRVGTALTEGQEIAAAGWLETKRLLLRPFESNDGDYLFRLYGDPEVMDIRKIGRQTRAQSDQQLAEIVEHWQRRGFGLAAVIEKATGNFIGECGLRERLPGLDEIELSYGLIPQSWGQGYASEAGAAALTCGLENLQLETIYAHARGDNMASRRVLGKLGFTLVEMRPGGSGKEVARYAINRNKPG